MRERPAEGGDAHRVSLALWTRIRSGLRERGWLLATVSLLIGALAPVARRAAHGSTGVVVAQLAVAFAITLGVGAALGRRLPRPIVIALLVGIALRVAYLYVTPFSLRTHDGDQHIEYVEYIVTKHRIPTPSAGWAFYHPPLYYLVSAVVWQSLALLKVPREGVMVALEVESLVYAVGFLVFALVAGKRWLEGAVRPRFALLAACLLCVWPSGIIHAVRVGNDDLFYFFFGAAFYFVTRWWQERRDRSFHLSAGAAALAMLTKSNGLLLFGVLGVLFVGRGILDRERSVRSYARKAWPALVLFAASTGATVVRSAADKGAHQVLVGNAEQLSHALTVGNGAANYLWFDLKMFVTQAYSNPWADDAGRQYFWNLALKTSILGEFQFDGAIANNIAVTMAALFVVLVACGFAGIVSAAGDELREELPLTVTIAVSLVGLAALRMAIPMACSNDFRYVWPILLPALCLYARGLTRLTRLATPASRGERAERAEPVRAEASAEARAETVHARALARLAGVGEASGWAFVCASVAFFVALTNGLGAR